MHELAIRTAPELADVEEEEEVMPFRRSSRIYRRSLFYSRRRYGRSYRRRWY